MTSDLVDNKEHLRSPSSQIYIDMCMNQLELDVFLD